MAFSLHKAVKIINGELIIDPVVVFRAAAEVPGHVKSPTDSKARLTAFRTCRSMCNKIQAAWHPGAKKGEIPYAPYHSSHGIRSELTSAITGLIREGVIETWSTKS